MITKIELSEARTYSKLENPTIHQQRIVVKLYMKLISKQLVYPDSDHPKFNQYFKESKNFFLNNDSK